MVSYMLKSIKLDVSKADRPDQKLFSALAQSIEAIRPHPLDIMSVLIPMAAHASVRCEVSKEDFLETAALSFDARRKQFGSTEEALRAVEDFTEVEARWVAAFREAAQ